MSSWHEQEEMRAAAAEGFDYSRLLWVGVALVVGLMLAAMFLMGEPPAAFSQVQVRHILIPSKTSDPAERQRAVDLAQTVRARLLDGESFDDLARQYSGDPGSANRGGYLGWSKRGVYTPSFEEYCWTGEVGAISDLIASEHGYHIIQIMDRQLSKADEYDREIDRKAWEQQRAEEASRVPGGAPALPAIPGTATPPAPLPETAPAAPPAAPAVETPAP
jgi:parvulin-like peptidyl-prolyl isomerase